MFAIAHVLDGPAAGVLAVSDGRGGVDLDAVRAACADRQLRPATPARASSLTGFLADWIPPVTLEPGLRAIVDSSLELPDVIYATAGEPGLVLAMRSEDLVEATAALVASIARPIASMV